MPVLEFHGAIDNIISDDGGGRNGVDLVRIKDWTRDWTDVDSCNGTHHQLQFITTTVRLFGLPIPVQVA